MRHAAVIALVLFFTEPSGFAQLPAARLDGVYPAGAQAGATLEVTLSGNDLDDAAELQFSIPGITAKPKMAEPTPFNKTPGPIPNRFVVTVAGNVPPGAYDVRVRGKYGLSNPRTFDVGVLAEISETEPNDEREQSIELALPLVVNGLINRVSDIDRYRFAAKAGDRILFDCRARRIDSPLDPVLRIYDAKGREVMNNREGYAKEAFLDFQVATSGEYYVRISDALYRGGANYAYRLSIGQMPHIDYVFPPAGPAGSNNQYTVFGRNLPGGRPSAIIFAGRRLEKILVNIALPADPALRSPVNGRIDPEQAFLDVVEYRVQGSPWRSNSVCVGIATAPVVLEAGANNAPEQAQKLSPPCEVAGQFYPQRDGDWYSFEAKQGDAYAIEVVSQRLGLPTDPQLVIQQVTKNDKGEEQLKLLATVDDAGNRDRAVFDARTGDAAYAFTAPVDATYRVYVRDGYSAIHTDPRLVYWLSIRKPRPDFRLVALPRAPWGAFVLHKGGRTTIDVLASRRDGCNEPIVVSVKGLPVGVTSSAVTLGPSMSVATLVLTAAENAPAATARLEVVGAAALEGRNVVRVARAGTTNRSRRILQPNQAPPNSLPARVSRGVVLTVDASDLAPLAVQLKNDKVWETTRAGILKIPYTVTRRNNYKGAATCVVTNLPANVNRTNFTIAGGATSGELQITLRNNTPAGIYTLYAAAYVQAFSYARNPEAAAAAKKRKEGIDKIAAAAAAASKTAVVEKQKADKAANAASNVVKTSQQKTTQAKKVEAAAIAAQKKANQTAQQAKAAADAKPQEANLKSRAAATQKAAATAAAKAASTAVAATAAGKALEKAQAKAKQAIEKKAAADKTAVETAAFAKAAAAEKKTTDKQATVTANAANPKNINYWTASTPITIKIHEYPVLLAALPETTKIKQGEKVELPLSITRLVDYAEQVNFSTIVRGVGGLSIRNVNILKGQTQIKLPISVAANATPGVHQITLRATMRVNNQALAFDRPFTLEIEKTEVKK